MSIVDEILAEESETPKQVTNNQLEQVAELAQRQLDFAGVNKAGDYITAVPSGSALKDLTSWVKKQETIYPEPLVDDHSIGELAGALIEKLRRYRMISESALPDIMSSLEMVEFTLANGFKIKIEDDVAASILSDKEEAAAEFLESIGCGDVVKDEVKVSLGKGERENAPQFLQLARKLGLTASEKLSVHAQTLKALVKEQLGQGVEFPETCFSVHPFKKTTIKPVKKK